MDELAQIRSIHDIDLQNYGLEAFANFSGFKPDPVQFIFLKEKVVGLHVYGTLDKACRDKILSLEDIQILYLGQVKGITNNWIGHLCELPSLKKLCLWNTCLNNAGAAKLSSSKTIEILDIRQTKVTDEGFESLSDIQTLRGLHAYLSPSIHYSSIESLNRLGNLQALLLQRTWNAANSHYIPRSTINRMTDGLSKLEEINIDYVGWGNKTGLEFLHNLPSLRTLSIQCFGFDESSVEVLSKDIPLEFLDLSYGSIQQMSLANKLFSYLRSVKKLRIQDFSISNEDVKPKKVDNIPCVYFRKKDVIDAQRMQRDMCELVFPVYKDSYSNSVHTYKKYFSWDQL